MCASSKNLKKRILGDQALVLTMPLQRISPNHKVRIQKEFKLATVCVPWMTTVNNNKSPGSAKGKRFTDEMSDYHLLNEEFTECC